MSLDDAIISHAVDLAAYSNSVVRKMMRILTEVDERLFAELVATLSRMSPSEFSVARLVQLLRSVREINDEAYRRLGRELAGDMGLLAAYEAEFADTLLRAAAADPLGLVAVAVPQVAAAVLEQPMRGRLMSEWASTLGQARMRRIQDSVAMGFIEGRTVGELVKGLRGTRAQNYADGLLAIDRRDAEAVVRTAVGHYAAAAREEVYRANAGAIEALVWTSTLDSRTSEWCRPRDGLEYSPEPPHKPLGHKFPWLGGPGRIHWNCRSTCVPRLKAAKALGLGDRAARAAQDGPVSGKMTYEQWLRRQSAARQDEILGPSRGLLFRRGAYKIDRFYDNRGRYLTLNELRQRDRQTFKELGL